MLTLGVWLFCLWEFRYVRYMVLCEPHSFWYHLSLLHFLSFNTFLRWIIFRHTFACVWLNVSFRLIFVFTDVQCNVPCVCVQTERKTKQTDRFGCGCECDVNYDFVNCSLHLIIILWLSLFCYIFSSLLSYIRYLLLPLQASTHSIYVAKQSGNSNPNINL